MNRLLKTGLAVSGGAVGARALRKSFESSPRYAPWERPPYGEFPHKVLVVGGGFAGYTAAKTLCELTEDRDDIGVMVVSRENYLTFWPMVPGIIGSEVDIENVAQPLRRPLIEAGASFRRAEVKSVDFKRKIVIADDGKEFPYEHLVLALGSQPNLLGVPGVKEHCLALAGLADALRVRNRVIERFEQATLSPEELPDPRLAFVVIGGGATGVETAAEIHALVHERGRGPDLRGRGGARDPRGARPRSEKGGSRGADGPAYQGDHRRARDGRNDQPRGAPRRTGDENRERGVDRWHPPKR